MSIFEVNFEALDKIAVAINLLQKHEPEDGYLLGFSGGKDSVVIEHLARLAHIRFDAFYNCSPFDPPEVKTFIKDFYPDTRWDYLDGATFLKKLKQSGLPQRNHKWCCEYIKEKSSWDRMVILGMRRQESPTRSQYQCFRPVYNGKKLRVVWVLPILFWTEQEVWEYIGYFNLPYCSLYDEEWKRIGCVLCPFENATEKADRVNQYPAITKCWKGLARKFFNARLERGTPLSFVSSSEEYFEWWLSGKPVPKQDKLL